ncbi:Protein shisa-4 [Armadillidium nasatum]|uniref:Protein shisa-4 n=1 Tax=Armadillidium nasatum TaxID=96803 RepID=A0A5N5SHY0_9CRUS|nr:Protein shisa-4 [Armadillidium nasatum]
MKAVLAVLILSLACIINESNGYQCEEENFLGFTKYKQCPGPGDPENYKFCCGTKERRYCCDNFLNLDEEDLEEFAKSLPAIIGTIIAVAFGLIVICIVCCCCCPFCLLHKRRTRGAVHNPAPVQAQLQPMMNAPPPQQTYGPPQPAPYPQAPYPTAAYPPPGAAPPAGFAPVPSSAPYPTQPVADQPPPYVEKQMPYNPNY